MKVVCIFCDYNIYLTIGKQYVVHASVESRNAYIITNDNGNKIAYPSKLFKTLSEVRNVKLEELGI